MVVDLAVFSVSNEPLPGSAPNALELAERKKEQGNRHFAVGRWPQASRRYQEGAAHLEVFTEAPELLLKLWLNGAQAQLKRRAFRLKKSFGAPKGLRMTLKHDPMFMDFHGVSLCFIDLMQLISCG